MDEGNHISHAKHAVLSYSRPEHVAWLADARAFLAPPRSAMNVMMLLLVLSLIWLGRFPGFEPVGRTIWVLMAIVGLAGWWLLRLLTAVTLALVIGVKVANVRRAIVRWSIVPMLVGLAWVTVRTDWPARLVLELHRPEMERVARKMLQEGSPRQLVHQPIGIYDFDRISTMQDRKVSFYATVDSWAYWFHAAERSKEGDVSFEWRMGSHD